MSGDLKQDLDAMLGSTASAMACGVELPVLAVPKIADLRARLERATVTEPGRVEVRCSCPCGIVSHTPEPPTDASLLADLRRELGEGWALEPFTTGHSFFVVHSPKERWFAYPFYSALRQSGPAKIAAALKLLAGVGE